MMKHLLAAIAAFLIPLAATAQMVVTETPGTFDLYQGLRKLSSTPSYPDCLAKAKSFGLEATFYCQTSTKISLKKPIPPKPADDTRQRLCPSPGATPDSTFKQTRTYASAPAPVYWAPGVWLPVSPALGDCPPPVVPPKPQDEFRSMSCPAGSAPGATWQQTRDYVPATPPVYWKVTDWAPATMPATACPPAPPPPTMHAGWPGIAEKSFDLSVTPGSREILVTPPVDFDCKTAADKVPGCNWPGPSIDGTGAFRNVAYRAKLGWFDPIVHPGEDNTAHLHQFFGNVNVNKDSTSASLLADCESTFRGGSVSCSAVWTPVMVDTKDNTVRPGRDVIVYYKKGAWTDGPSVQAVPIGLKMVIGGPSATSYTRWGVAGFSCDGIAVASDSSEPFTGGVHRIPTLAQCGVGHEVWMTAVAANCWDGVNLYKPDGSHMAYPPSPWPANILPNGCMPDHPILLPQVAVLVITTIGPNDDPGRWVLSSDKPQDASLKEPGDIVLSDGRIVKPGVSMHADYFGAIPLDIQKRFLDGCIHPLLDCQAHMLGNGHTMNSFNGN